MDTGVHCDNTMAHLRFKLNIVSGLGQDKGYTIKYNPLPEGFPESEARGNF